MALGMFQNHVYSVHYCKSDDANFSQVTISENLDKNAATSDMLDNSDKYSDFNHDDTFANNKSARDSLCCPSSSLQNSSALFLLVLKEKYKLTQVAVQGVIEGVSNLNQHQMSFLRSQVCIILFCPCYGMLCLLCF